MLALQSVRTLQLIVLVTKFDSASNGTRQDGRYPAKSGAMGQKLSSMPGFPSSPCLDSLCDLYQLSTVLRKIIESP